MTRRIVILTGSELRHTFLRTALAAAPGIDVVRTWCEGVENTLVDLVAAPDVSAEQKAHIAARARSEEDFFGAFVRIVPDRSNPVRVPRGGINDASCAEATAALRPDLMLAYGCSLVREPLLSAFPGRFLNVHLGLSPYYRGTGTNFWPLVNGEPEYVGATFMHIDAGVDTGEVVHQIRARVFPGDTPHQIGNRLIADMAFVYAAIVRDFDRLERLPQMPVPEGVRVYRRRDFSEAATAQVYRNFADGMVERYLADRARRDAAVPILSQPILSQPVPSVPSAAHEGAAAR